MHEDIVLVAGYGTGFGAALARQFIGAGFHVAGVSRHASQNNPQAQLSLIDADMSDEQAVADVFQRIDAMGGRLRVVIHNPGYLVIEPLEKTTAADFEQCWQTMTLSAFHLARQALPRLLQHQGGTLIFSGATASVRGGARFAAFASAKFALRGLAQSLAREFQHQGVHVAHVLLDGIIWGEKARQRFRLTEQQAMMPDDIAEVYLNLSRQPSSTWTQELDLRPAGERF